ncbi:hypothetical protein M8C21_000376 [Ambrosia artemisiifolia]|uniref:non-specific serine/threonine protein kinase n=1 Tax=Ambrosia artemisiifolia TaxID=4212 RepID=A0AAD5CUJ0_AMBAR|nr:hypothetical protein M8C21_000376 [Ambrosia artemisiifolia]
MDLHWCFFYVLLFLSYPKLTTCDQEGFWSISCGGATNFVDSSNISWEPDASYIAKGNTTTVNLNDTVSSSTSLRFFPDPGTRKCYKLPLPMNYGSISSLILIRASFVYKNYDGLQQPPLFHVSLGTAIAANVKLAVKDPWVEEFIWQPDNRDVLLLCLNAVPNGGYPVISSIEIRPVPKGGYYSGMEGFENKLLRKRYRINCGYTNGSIRYPLDQYDRIWDPDQDFSPFHISTAFKTLGTFNTWGLNESPPQPVLQTGRVLARREGLSYNFSLENNGDYYVVLYFAGILPVSPTFDVLINGEVVESNYSVQSWQVGSLYFLRKGIKSLNITFKDISFYPLVNAIEVYEIVNIPPESSTTVVSALQVIQQSTGLDLEWEDDPCSPTPWEHIQCEGSSVTSLELFDINLRSISPTVGDLFDLKTLDLHNTSIAGEIENLGSLKSLENLNLSFNKLTSFGTDLNGLISLQVLDLKNNSLEGQVPESLGGMKNLHLLVLENNHLQGTLPKALNKDSLEIRYGDHDCLPATLGRSMSANPSDPHRPGYTTRPFYLETRRNGKVLCRTSGNLCLSFSMSKCHNATANSTIDAPKVSVFNKKKQNLHSHLAVVLGAVGGVFVVLIVAFILVFLYTRRNKNKAELEHKESLQADLQMMNCNSAKVFSYREIKVATRNFKQALGRGSFGSVYLGKLPDGKLTAVKVRSDKTQLGSDSFINEVSLLSSIQHQNLVSLEGYCNESKHQILVYEYLPGGSLAENLYGTNSKRVTLSWARRLKIAIDAAKGTLFLSNRARPYLQAGAFEIVDESLKGTYDEESMRKAASIASRSVDRDASQRPNISEVVAVLKESYSIQLSYLATGGLPT